MMAMSRYLPRLFAVACLLVSLPPRPSSADTVRLKNGAVVDGIVASETGTHIVIEIGTGSMRVKRGDVASIRRSSDGERAAMREAWARKHYLHRKFVPKDMQGLVQAFRDLSGKRSTAVAAWSALARGVDEETAIRKAIDQAKSQLTESSQKLKKMDPADNVEEYNALVHRVNTLNAEITLKHRELEGLIQERRKSPAFTSEYLDALSSFETLLEQKAEAVRKRGADDRAAYLVSRLADEAAAFDRDFSRTTVQTSKSGTGRVVDVVVNDSVEGRFILDTGASVMTMSESFRRRAGVDVDRQRTLNLVLADGSMLKAPSMVLGSVSLGDARAERVEAAVLTDPPAAGVDGLLGMSFLGRFVLRLDGATGKLTLTELAPNAGE